MRVNHVKDSGKIVLPFELLFFIFLLCTPMSLLAQQTTKQVGVNDLLELSLVSYESLPPYAMHVETELSFSVPQSSVDGEIYIFEKRYDNTRLDVLYQRYEVRGQEKKLVYDKRGIWTGEQFQWRQQYLGSGIDKYQQIIAAGSFKDDEAKRLLVSPYSGSFTSGFLVGDSEHVCNILKQSGVAKLYDKTETIDGNACYVVEGETQNGRYKIWIDPNSGFNVRKAIVNKKIGDLYYSQPITTKKSQEKVFLGCEINLSDVEVEKVGVYFIPTSANLIRKDKYSDGTTGQVSWSSKRSKIQLNPNFEKMGAFVMDGIPEGTRIVMNEYPGLKYIWANGRFILDVGLDVIEDVDKVTQEIISNGDVPPMLGSIRESVNIDAEPNALGVMQSDNTNSQSEVLSETGFSLFMLLIPIGLLIIAVVGWQIFGRLKT